MERPEDALIWSRWEEVDRLFDQALDLAVEDRWPFLTDACAGDVLLLDTVSRLLDASDRAADVFSGPGSNLLRAAFTAGPREPLGGTLGSGSTVGRYRLLREIGKGGMATVYEAERVDGVLERKVAVKLLRGVDSGDLVRRFLEERKILSALVHPNIARLLDGGATEEGRPYIVMELVKGEPLTQWADRHRLSIHERLRLFLQALDAVQYAHTRLVVHRDIKPSNVMVGEDGRIRLLDFGIAKLLEAPAESEAVTDPATRWMTPEYASPEQILGHPVTAATDVHAFGVLLYELLTGRRPFGNGAEAGFELERAICERIPPPPSSVLAKRSHTPSSQGPASPPPESLAASRRTPLARVRRTLAADLDAVVARALRKRPEDRYRSAQEMGDDIERFLGGFPVRAREGLRAYRARRFVRRHWLAVGMTTILAGVLGGSAILLAGLQAETARQRDLATAAAGRAQTEAENSQLVIDFLADVFRSRDPTQAPNDTLTARELVEWGVRRVDQEFADRPAVQAELLLVLGEAYENLGLPEEGADLMQRALALRRQLFGSESEEVAEALSHLAELERAARETSLAIPLYREAIDIRRLLSDADNRKQAASLAGLGLAFADQERPDSAEVLLRAAVGILGRNPADAAYVGTSLQLARVLRGAGKLDEARALYEEGVPKYRSLPDHDPMELAAHLNNFAYLRRVSGDLPGAEPLYRESLDILAEVLGRGHPNTLTVAANLAGVLTLMGRQEDAVTVLRRSLGAAEAQWPEGGWRVTSARRALGDALLRAGRIDEAESVLRAAALEFQDELGPQHEWTSFTFARIAVIQELTGQGDQAKAFMDRLHGRLMEQRAEAGGELPVGTVHELNPLLYILEEVGLDREHRRFSELLPDRLDGADRP